jgi:hypothetical protein
MSNSHKTAMGRVKPSAPMVYLETQGVILAGGLDFGCGKGFDAEYYGMDKYDPHFHPEFPRKRYSVITCNYVLNTLSNADERASVITEVDSLLTEDGIAYVTVRNDRDKLNGWTKKGTYQCLVILPFDVIRHVKGYRMYTFRKGDSIGKHILLG